MHHRNLGAGPNCDVGEFEGDVTSANENDPSRKGIQFEKVIACSEQFRSVDLQIYRFGSGRDHYVPALQQIFSNLKSSFSNKPSASVKSFNAGIRHLLFGAARNRLGERAFEFHQFGPVDLQLPGVNSATLHSSDPIDGFRSAYQHFLWIAAPLRARAAEGSRIDNRDTPSAGAALSCHRGTR
jgi:hypothetical protein